MKPFLIVASLAAVLAFAELAPTGKDNSVVKEPRVWICLGPSAYAHHVNRQCRGLNQCSRAIISTTRDSAINYYDREQPCRMKACN